MNYQLLKLCAEKWTPRAYQKKAAKFLLEHSAALLLQDPGLGKTVETLAAIKVLKNGGHIDRALIVAPLRVMASTWPREICKWKDFNDLTFTILHGAKKEERLQEETDIHLINPEGLDWLLNMQEKRMGARTIMTPDLKRWRDCGYDLLVIDEISKFKSRKSNRNKALMSVLSTFPRRWGLTGSPAPNGLLDLFGQCLLIDGGATFGPYITQYRKQFFMPSGNGFSWELAGDWAEKAIYKKLSKIALTMRAEDYLDMPRVVDNMIKVDLPPAAREVYDAFEEHLIAQVDAKTITAANAGVRSMKCRQIAQGAVYVDEEVIALLKLPRKLREWAEIHDEKIDALDSLVSELQGSPVLVAYDFGHDLARIRKWYEKKFGTKYGDFPFIGSGVTLKRQNELETLWNAGALPFLAGHPASMGHGLNLQESGHNVCFFSMTWDFDLYDQLIRRVHRQGQKADRVFVHHILAANTVDIDMLYALRGKRRGQNALFEALKGAGDRRKRGDEAYENACASIPPWESRPSRADVPHISIARERLAYPPPGLTPPPRSARG